MVSIRCIDYCYVLINQKGIFRFMHEGAADPLPINELWPSFFSISE